MTKKSRQKLNIWTTKRAFKMKLKAFFINFKGLSWKQIKIIFLEGESLTLNSYFAMFSQPENYSKT